MKEEYIDVNRLKENLTTEIYSYSKGDIRKRLFARGLSLAYDIVNRQPTVDAVEVVRCRDCRFFEDEDYYGNCYCEEWGNITNANGYCHDAERRKKDEVG